MIIGGRNGRLGLLEGYSRRINEMNEKLTKLVDEEKSNKYINTFREEQKYLYIRTNRV